MTRLLSAGALVLVVAVASLTEADPDLWGHVRFGADIARAWQLPSLDPYSFTQDRSWINHEWLSELQMGLAWMAGGPTGLVALKAALVAAAVVLVWSALHTTEFGVRLLCTGLFVIGAGRAFKTLRPQLWSILCFVILCRVLAERWPAGRRWLPLLFVVWANVHGGWLVGLGVVGVWAAVSIAADRRQAGAWITIVASCALGTLCTPYGWRLWRFLWETVGITRDITEWQPLWTVPAVAWLPWLAALGITAWAGRHADPDRWARTAVVVMLAYFSFRVERVLPFLTGAAVLFAAPLARVRRNRGASAPLVAQPAAGSSDFVLAVVLTIMMTAAGFWIGASAERCIPVRGSWVADRDAGRALLGARGRLVNPFDWGEYAIWHFGPHLRVSMDGRRETVYSDQRLVEHDAIVNGTALGFSRLASWKPEYVWLPAESMATRAWLEAHGYRIQVETNRSFIGVRHDATSLQPFAASGENARRCFPQ